MRVALTLIMNDVRVQDRLIDKLIFEWISDLDQQEIMDVSQRWITTQNFLTNRMVGLQRVGESRLSFEPLE